jgi:hypothetical protein
MDPPKHKQLALIVLHGVAIAFCGYCTLGIYSFVLSLLEIELPQVIEPVLRVLTTKQVHTFPICCHCATTTGYWN